MASPKAENRKFFSSFFMLLIICGLIAYLTFIPVPTENKDLIITVLGVLLGGASTALPNLFGSKDLETDKLKKDLSEMGVKYDNLLSLYELLKSEHENLKSDLVNRYVMRKPRSKAKPKSTT